MTYDPTETIRRNMLAAGQPHRDLQAATVTWDTTQLSEEFTVTGFAAPFVVVVRKADGARGTLEFTHSPRVYFNFVEDER